MNTRCSSRRQSGTSIDRKSTRLNSSHANISYAVFCLKKKKNEPAHWFDDNAMAKADERSKKLYFLAGREQVAPYKNRTCFFFKDTATTEIYTLSLHDALPISASFQRCRSPSGRYRPPARHPDERNTRSEEHTSELQSRQYLVCRLLLEKKKKKLTPIPQYKQQHNQTTNKHK